jgi:cardiolipin synthase
MVPNVPNGLTLFRIAVIPVIVALFYVESPAGRWIAGGLFTVAAISDFLDGYIARALDIQSDFGRMLDPIADKLLVSATLLMLVGFGDIGGVSLVPAVVILTREIVVSGLREFLASLSIPVPVSQLSKWKTTLQLIAIGVLIIGNAIPAVPQLHAAGIVGLWIAGVITLITGYDYLRASLRKISARTPHEVSDELDARPHRRGA